MASSPPEKTLTTPIAPNNPGLDFIIGSLTNPKVVLHALIGVTEVKVVSSPSVVVDNQPAILKVGDEIPIKTQSGVTDGGVSIQSFQYRDTGVILKVIPRVNSTGLVTMDVEQEVSQVANQSSTGVLTPTVSQRQVASTISVYSGQMVALGGLISELTPSPRRPRASHRRDLATMPPRAAGRGKPAPRPDRATAGPLCSVSPSRRAPWIDALAPGMLTPGRAGVASGLHICAAYSPWSAAASSTVLGLLKMSALQHSARRGRDAWLTGEVLMARRPRVAAASRLRSHGSSNRG